MKEDNSSQLGDYDAPFCEQQYTHGYCYIFLFKFRSFYQYNTPQTASNFRHLLSRGTIAVSYTRADQDTGGALLEFSLRTAMHGTSCVSSAISVWNNSACSLNSGCSSMGKALGYRP